MIDLCGIELRHPVINGSGTFDAIAARRAFGDELLGRFPFAAFVSKTITPEPRAGNPPPRLFETPSGMINSIGLPNKGLEGFLAADLPELASLPVSLIVSVMASSREEFATLVERVGDRPEVAAIELNGSCPNVKSGLIVGEQPDETRALCAALRPLTERPLIVQLTPNCADPAAVAPAAQEGGPDAVPLINTVRATALDPVTPGRVTIYTCGSTVYRYAHIGNLRTYLFGDLLRLGRFSWRVTRSCARLHVHRATTSHERQRAQK